ncbi:neuroglobin-like [Mizuhopecten yessoensis]|uniref:Neuroglobin n=1 Tax=Mizuhopecten yessoensis TaxID=6573 RepID=A0A210PL01_MIZYE|nr:neuroglobin-like [Mizuhopecten yessoensis]OWF37155.1 Neuroglobin [Mizuhopecten yessoensis]
MGCVLDKSVEGKHLENETPTPSDLSPGEEPRLTEEEIKMLEDCWITLKGDIEKVGVITFIGLFETHPEVQDSFLPFRQLSKKDLELSAILKSHSLRVMGTVDKCIARASQPEKLRDLMSALGQRHISYSAQIEFIEMVGMQFVYAIEPHLKDSWSPELRESWLKLFRVMTYYMAKGMKSTPTKTS